MKIVGVGETPYSRRSGKSVQALAAEATKRALQDAQLDAGDVNGIVPLGGYLHVEDLIAGAGLPDYCAAALPPPGGNSGVDSLRVANALIAAGEAHTVAVVIAKNGSSETRIADRVGFLAGQQFRAQLERPQGWSRPVEWYAMIARRHMLEFGTSKDNFAAVALAAYGFANGNPRAMRYSTLLTKEKYHSAAVVADPYQIYDCCLETDGAAAIILTCRSQDCVRDIDVLSVASGRPPSPDDLTNRPDWYQIGLAHAAPKAFEAASLGPTDMDAAMIYDCFTFEVIHQLEVAGFCETGLGGQFVSSGAIGPGGTLPVNTHGGLLAEGHLSGINHIIEAVRQLRGEAGNSQLENPLHIAVTGWGDWGDGSLAVLGVGGQ